MSTTQSHPLRGPNRFKLGLFSANADGGLPTTFPIVQPRHTVDAVDGTKAQAWITINNPTMADGVALFHASHANLATGGDDLTVSAVAQGRDAAESIHRALSANGRV